MTFEDFISYDENSKLAKKARILTQPVVDKDAKKQIKKISKKIYRAAKRGKTECWVDGNYNILVLNYFEQEGFKCNYIYGSYVIKWKTAY